jgi:hypothetical protein
VQISLQEILGALFFFLKFHKKETYKITCQNHTQKFESSKKKILTAAVRNFCSSVFRRFKEANIQKYS